MAQQDYNEIPLPQGPENQIKRQTHRHLPNFFRTNSNKKFLGGTLDVITQPGTLTRISSYVGRRDIPNYKFDEDNYIQESSTPRQYYQLEPAFVNEDSVTGEVKWYGDYIDYINSLKYFGANVGNHSKLNKQEAYAWDPHIDWDKFTNYREYYWLTNGPDPVTIYGHLEGITSEYTVTFIDQIDNLGYIFTPDGLTVDPRLTLYRGVTYTFDINTPGMKFAIKTQNEPGDSYFYNVGVSKQNVDKGKITFTVPYDSPDLLYYMDNTPRENNGVLDETIGMIDIKDIKEAAYLNVETEILGKRNFTTSTGIEFINGLKVQFVGNVTPAKYAKGYWYVEGVGTRITLINTLDLEAPATFIKSQEVPFDDQPFDSLPWDNADNYPLTKDYIVINRASRDRNNWARTNRWFHRTVLETSATANKQIANLNQNNRADRPIIEFEPDLKLYNHGYFSKADIDLVDTVTTDVFSIIEGSTGYIVDGEQVLPGYRILFTADPDILVKGRIFEVKQILNVNENASEDITVISTSATNNIITVPETNTLRIGMPVKFTGTVVGGLSSSTTYYIANSNFTDTTFSVTTQLNVRPERLVTLTDSSVLTMKVSSSATSSVTRRKKQLTLQEVSDTEPVEGEIVYVTKGKTLKGSSFYYENGLWNQAQKKTKVNQAPLFDLFDEDLVSYHDMTVYPYNNFSGTKLFNYKVGTGTNDSELGFPIIYRAIDNVGDIEFEFSLQKDTWTYTRDNILNNVNSYSAFLRKWNLDGTFSYNNGWIKTDRDTEQNVVRILQVNSTTDLIPIDVYDDTTLLYSLEEANQLLKGNQLYIATQDSYSRDLADTDYWLPFDYKEQYRIEYDIDASYLQRDIVRYKGYYYIALENIKGKLPTNTDYWKFLFQGYLYKGNFNRVTNYNVDDIVSYNGSTYIAIQAQFNQQIFPDDINYWKILVKGSSTFQDEYDSTKTYYTNDIVSYGLYLYISKTSNNIGNLPTDLGYWTQLASGSIFPQYYISDNMYHTGDVVVLDRRPKIDYRIRVYVNNEKRNDLTFSVVEGVAYINFGTPLSAGDKVVYKVRSISNKNVKGYYEVPLNWQNNPMNDTVDNFTFGEVVDHVRTIIENSAEFSGTYPGIGNLSNLGHVSQYGRKFMQHTGPMSLSSFLMIDKNVNIIKSLQWASREYTQFKKDIIFRMQTKGFDGTPRDIADQLLLDYTTTKNIGKAAFYFSDMVPHCASSVREYTVEDPRFPVFVIDSIFNPKTQTKRSILIYVNEVQLIYGKEYTFDTSDAFVTILAPLSIGDQILIKDYSTTDGCYVPFTPSKLGLYPLYEPMIYIDNTHRTIVQNADGTESPASLSRRVIQGHDGSLFTAYGDYRDDVLLEIEKRIFNGVRVDYDPDMFDIYDVLTGYYRRTDFTKAEINDILITEFLRWNSIPSLDFNSPELTVPGELTPRFQWVDGDSFTYNYNKSLAPNQNESLYGYWRAVYKYFYDTDRPHTHPWEMQGFTIKPIWWEDIYGPSPYSSENKIMWDAIEKGQINDPTNRKINLKFARPGLGEYLPVDEQGNLLSPADSGLAQNFSKVNTTGRYTFGDQAPVETAWRQSSEYPFAIMIAMCVLRGSEFIGKMWDRFSIKRNIAGQVYSTITNKKVSPTDLPFANEIQSDGTRTITNGLANLIDEYVLMHKNVDYNYYKSLIRGLDVKLRYRLGGFSSKEKINVLLDSRTPNSSGIIFLPQENYKIFYNKSAPVETVTYSGVIIEKKTNGYAIRGYDREKNVFEIFPPQISAKDTVINIGGISESYVDWAPNIYYVIGQLVKINSNYYRALVNHTSSANIVNDLDANKWRRLPALPITGGVDAYVRTKFINSPIKVPYGTVFTDIQSVVDFLLGYQERLRDWGFQFDDFSTDLNLPLNWLTSAKEFMFWTLQNWGENYVIWRPNQTYLINQIVKINADFYKALEMHKSKPNVNDDLSSDKWQKISSSEIISGSIITLSPAANNLKFSPAITASVDTLNSDFYEYSIYKADGSPLKADLTDIYREDNGFRVQPTTSSTTDGIFHIRSNLVYQEHVLLFDNLSIFGDVIYDVVPGYRQGRLKLLGFKTNNWDGSYYSPGFIYDNASILEWQPNVDYNIGDVVLYKNFYFTSLNKVYGTTEFDYTQWSKLSTAPTPKLEPNLDYRIEQFRDFYSLESSNFDSNQQNLARHLTGYQERQYLQDIIIDDVSQYKFYQGYIKEKGTMNSISKLFDALRGAGFSSIDIKEEWAFKVGDFGASDAYTELEFILDETKFRHNPQDIALTLSPTDFSDSSIYNITAYDTVKRTVTYDANPFVTKALDFTQTNYGVFKYGVAGYVNPTHVDHILYDENALLNYDITQLKHRDKIWIGNTPNGNWNVMAYFNTKSLITNWERISNVLNLYLNVVPQLLVGDLVVVRNLGFIDGTYKVAAIYNNFIQVYTNNVTLTTTNSDSTNGVLFKFESVRYQVPSSVSISRYNDLNIKGEKLWIDKDSKDEWKVLENTDVFTPSSILPPLFLQTENALNGYEVKVSGNGKFLYVSAIGSSAGKILIYTRPNNATSWAFLQTIAMPTDFNTNSGIEKFGYSIDVSYDGKILIVSAPDISGIKSYYKGDFDASETYVPDDVVRYNNQLWKNLHSVIGDGSTITIDNQDWALLEEVYEVSVESYNSHLTKQGAVFVYVLNETNERTYSRDTYVYKNESGYLIEREQIICSYIPMSNERFGTKVKLVQSGSEYWLYVSSEYFSKSGAVQVFKRTADGVWQYNINQIYLNFNYSLQNVFPSPLIPGIDSLYGYDVSVYGSYIAVSAPFTNGGAIYIFEKRDTIFYLVQVVDQYIIRNNLIVNDVDKSSYISDNDYFGYSLSMKGNDLFVSAPNNDLKNSNVGVIYRFKYNGVSGGNNPFTLSQLILPPSSIQNERFGSKIDTNSDQSILAVSSIGGNVIFSTTFDTYTDRLVFNNDSTRNYELDPNSLVSLSPTIFDQGATVFFDRVSYTGATYIFNSFDDNFIYADKLSPTEPLITNDNFGSSISVADNCIVVGSPNRHVNNIVVGKTYVFDYNTPSWAILVSQSEVVDTYKFKKSFIYNTVKNVLVNELDFVDPAKGLIPGPANQEIKYQTMRDPASYTYVNSSGVFLDQSDPWTDNHLGEVWWDLSRVKWIWYEQGDSSYRNSYWNTLFPGSSIDVYEWVETTYLPSEWVTTATTTDPAISGVSGTPIYTNDLTYSTKQKYDPISGYLITYYYYWVRNKVTIPNVGFRNISVYDVAQLILDPAAEGYKFIAITGKNSLSLFNVKPDIYHRDINLNVQFYEVDNTDLIVHREYALIAEKDANSRIPTIVENKWFDSLCGVNVNGQLVPDPRLSVQQRYGARNEPRQSWFANRYEALKQYIEYVNSVLIKNQIVDNVNFVNLLRADPQPTINSGKIDQVVDILDDLRFIGTSKLRTTLLTPIVKDGKIVNVTIDDHGYGYKVPPIITISGTGTGAVLRANIDSNGSVISVDIIKSGAEYDTYSTRLIVRNYTVLVLSDVDALNGWSLHDWSGPTKKSWNRIKTQGWNVTRYWYYADWYATGFSKDSTPKYQVERTINLEGLTSQVGDLVKVNNINGNWLLLQRISEVEDPNYTVTYKVVGKQNATIQFSDKLYNLNRDLGYDTIYSYDTNLYDQGPNIELRIILEAIRDNILINDLRIEYINTFFNSVNYALHEQLYVDWVFKTSFLKVNHNVGSLKQRITFQDDTLPSYQKYIEEVKPYKSKIREFLDSYNGIDDAYQQTTDFDLFSYYNQSSGRIERGSLDSVYINTYPWKDWYDNHTFEIIEIDVYDQGNGYISKPQVIITGDGRDAAATAYIANGKVYKIIVDNPGYGYTKAPTVYINGGLSDTGLEVTARAIAKIGNNKVRTNTITMKYDRIIPNYTVDTFVHTDTFSGDGTKKAFKLTYAPDIKKVNFNILVNNIEIYGSLYDVSIVETLHDTYTALEGYVTFKTAPSQGKNNIVITYHKNIALFDASNRINYAYNPTTGQYGKDLAQLMTGVDYGGVQLTSIEFDIGAGWDVIPWDVSTWDNIPSTNDDFVVASDGTTRTFTLPYIPAVGEVINVYINSIRVDDPYFSQYDYSTVQPNGLTESPANTIMDSFVGDGINNVITIPSSYHLLHTDYITFRKSTSDGTILPTDRSLIDSFVDGGDLTYTSALGIKSEEIVIDGDGLITSDTSYGPEELIQGQVVDTLEIKVYHAPSFGGPNVNIRNYTGDGRTNTFEIGAIPTSVGGIFVLINGIISHEINDSTVGNDYSIDFANNLIILNQTPSIGDKIVIITIDTAGYDFLEKVNFIGDGSTTSFVTNSRFETDNISGFVTVNGVPAEHFTLTENVMLVPFNEVVIGRTYRIVTKGDTEFSKYGAINNQPGTKFVATGIPTGTGTISYVAPGDAVVTFDNAPLEGEIIQIMTFRGTVDENNIRKWSEVNTQYINVIPGTNEYILDPGPAVLSPLSATAFVVVDDEFLQAPDYEFYTYDGSVMFINDLRYSPNTLEPNDIDVYKNGVKLRPVADYLLDSDNNSVTINSGSANIGDSITIEIYKFADYRLKINTWDGSTIQNISLEIDSKKYQLLNQKLIRVTTFTNHDIIKIKTSDFGFEFKIGYDVLQYDVTQYDITSTAMNTSGIFDLPRVVGDKSGVFVALNRKLLSPNVDYVVLDDHNQVKVILPDNLKGNDYIQIITFDDKTVQPSYGFRIFKDMLNRTHYKRLDSSTTTVLKHDLLYSNTTIVVKNGDILQEPDRLNNLPGVIEIEGERIEYFKKDGNTLSQLRRGTLGTGTRGSLWSPNSGRPDRYLSDTYVEDVGADQTAPYSDQENKKTFYGDDHTQVFPLEFTPRLTADTVTETSIPAYSSWHREYVDRNINAGNFVVGEKYKIVSVGTTDFTMVGAASNKIGIIFVATNSGSGSGIASHRTYLSIPETFGQCDEIEVFVAGRRLNKVPHKIYEQELGQDSYKGAGDVLIEAEFSVDGTNPVVRLTKPPHAGDLVVVVYKTGRLWQKISENSSLVYSNTDVARFLRSRQVILPK